MMDFLKKATGGDSNKDDSNQAGQSSGGGAQGEKDEDGLDEAVDMFQEKVLGQGDQRNESAAEQAKDEMISDGIRDQYKNITGSDFPIKDKEKKIGF